MKIVDNNEQTILIQYTNNRITTISDGADRNFTLTYGNDGNLNKIVSPYGDEDICLHE